MLDNIVFSRSFRCGIIILLLLQSILSMIASNESRSGVVTEGLFLTYDPVLGVLINFCFQAVLFSVIFSYLMFSKVISNMYKIPLVVAVVGLTIKYGQLNSVSGETVEYIEGYLWSQIIIYGTSLVTFIFIEAFGNNKGDAII